MPDHGLLSRDLTPLVQGADELISGSVANFTNISGSMLPTIQCFIKFQVIEKPCSKTV